MKISQQLKEKNIAEYLIYMWQVEDLLRANKCDIDLIRSNVISRYPAEEHAALEEWYGNLADMMRAEGVTEKGHLQINRNVIRNLTDLHADLLASTKYPFYNAAYFKALPFIVELRQKSGQAEESELETCFEAALRHTAAAFAEKGNQPGHCQGDRSHQQFSFPACQLLRQREERRVETG